MNKTYDHKTLEKEIYVMWEKSGAFSPEGAKTLREQNGLRDSDNEFSGKPFSVLMPPPNANAPIHCGHATYSLQDILIRFKRMQGYDALYFPGTDHAGFETQYVYENKLKKEGKSRFDFDRETFFNDVLSFVNENSDIAINQLKLLGMSADWKRNTFMLDKKVVDTVYDTFIKMYKEGLIYREGYMVNYSTFYGTTFSDLETEYKDSVSPLYYVKYAIGVAPKKEGLPSYMTVATVRPETIYADVAIAVNPKDKRYKGFVGKEVINPLTNEKIPVIEDEYADIEFGTGCLKITPGHDFNDYKIGKKHGLKIISLISLDGRMNENAGETKGLFPAQARKKVVEILQEKGSIEKINDNYENRLLVDYKEGNVIEPMILPNWFINMDKLLDPVISAIEKNKVKFNLPEWKRDTLRWIKEKKPWPISRQTVFGIRIPAWYSVSENPNLQVTFLTNFKEYKTGKVSDLLKAGISLSEIKSGLQKVITTEDAKYVIQKDSPGDDFLQETDTFDTWFSSGQWPLTTTGFPDSGDFKKYYPTDFLDSGYDIMFFWIARMIMFGLYLTKEIPFKNVYFHGMVTGKDGRKMSKSKNNGVNPVEMIEKYGTDALRMGLIVGGNTEAKFSPFDEDKVRGYRNFANKIWNVGRFINQKIEESNLNIPDDLPDADLKPEELEFLKKLEILINEVTKDLDRYKFKLAGESIYDFIWNTLANDYLESIKSRDDVSAMFTLRRAFLTAIKLLHPFMPFVTEAVWQEIKKPKGESNFIIISKWPS
ncbi:valine--tRNA ligase [candidate division WWE3 bacterium CG_4_9_14_0_2_um_filter_35_11]|uniref:Valine--tRNA ligase n=1 Tax=candidate division WWE3 bacterium CG_4_9_14_0_2_um_filter_35_11 TaxID=1975077 RepID=A0A2M8EL20_UNCKA|nr:MAG: valine--tRNA ligase [candidate division WWE3 bacterium CG10_big_fil_rev_8_21_14_0_10_35_32]PJC23442.1 MAG: valine--tRNA ligase [candidate division WWE3 bacterium CG_4_9_14_0_2_um_filter_35_11]